MPISPAKSRIVNILLYVLVISFGAILYFKAESGASSVITMAGEKSLAAYKAGQDSLVERVLAADVVTSGATTTDESEYIQ